MQTQNAGGNYSVRHDAAGNITSDDVNSYTYNDRGRMSSANPGGNLRQSVAYAYNAVKQRVAKSGPSTIVPTGASYYVYDEEGKLLGGI